MDNSTTKTPYFKRLKSHFSTVTGHKREVMKNCFKCGLYIQGITHDLSKFSLEEFGVSVRYFQGNRSPYMYEKELYGYSLGWLHHKSRNKHHWEYWYDMLDGKWVPIEMPLPYFVEMVCDRVAACKIYEKENYTDASALNYYFLRNDRLFMHPKTAEKLEKVLGDIRDYGEDAVFAQLKEELKGYVPEKHRTQD